MHVILTVDTETYPVSSFWMSEGLRSDLARDIYGRVSTGRSVGLTYQLDVLRRHKLRAVFMVESLFAAAPQVGIGPLRQIVQEIVSEGHDVQLHPHPEWVPFVPALPFKSRSHLISGYTEEEQTAIIALSSQLLMAAGAPKPRAFRAGDFAANAATMRALVANRIDIDCSYNRAFATSVCQIPDTKFLGCPSPSGEIWEFPVAGFEDYPGHFRPAQLAACSFREMRYALEQAYAAGWQIFVVVSHSFEMLKNRRHPRRQVSVRDTVVARFEKLSSYLDQHRDRFVTSTFAELDLKAFRLDGDQVHLKGRLAHTGLRIIEQFLERITA